MEIIPAIDIINGACVRLYKGDYDKKTKYFNNPLEAAKKWISCGARWIHFIDLDGAKEGYPKNLNIALKIKEENEVMIEYGGGVRNHDSLLMVLKAGVDRVIIGTRAIESLDSFNRFYEISGKKTIISLDFGKDCSVFKEGWLSASSLNLFDFGKKIKSYGSNEIIITDITRDGTLEGINIDMIKDFIKKTNLNVFVAGGISSIEDIKKLKEIEELGIKGAIIGKALYEGRIDLNEAIKIAGS